MTPKEAANYPWKKAIRVFDTPEPGIMGWTNRRESYEVNVLATNGIWAMVRRKGCTPFVCHVKELEPCGN